MRSHLLQGLIVLAVAFGVASVRDAKGQSFGAPQFARTLYDPADLTGKLLPEAFIAAAKHDGLDLKALRGRPVVVSYWATWCGRCTAALADMDKLAASTSLTVVAIDFDRDPALAEAYLSKHHIQLRNIHDDGGIRATARGSLTPPYAMSLVLDANGRVIYAQWSIFKEELLAAVASLGPEFAGVAEEVTSAGEQNTQAMSSDQIRDAAISVVRAEPDYLSEQRKFVCRYDIKTLRDYGSGRATSSEEQLEEVMATNGGRIETRVVNGGQPGQSDSDALLASNSFAIWKDPILSSVLAHSLISNVAVHMVVAKDGHQDRFAYFTFRGDPTFHPENETDQVAQSMVGSMEMELNRNVLLMIDGNTDYAVTRENRFLVERRMPLLIFNAVPYQGVFLPSLWSESWFQPVANDRIARQHWSETLVRTFGKREGCREFEVNSTILPGFGVVPNGQK